MSANTAEAVRDALQADGRITSKTIHVSVEDDSITLHGIVDSLEEMGLAEEIAEAASGCKVVHNHLGIDREVDTGPCCPQM
jgi:osmotically-inducible protein OsmY